MKSVVEKIVNEVRMKGDQALLKIGRKFYGKNYLSLDVTPEEISQAYINVDKKFIKALKQMKKNITKVHQAQLPRQKQDLVSTVPGVTVWREWRAIEKVGIYVPGGKAIYPSSVLMTVIPAKIAGCKDIIICTPPKSDGAIPSATLVAADILGVKKIYKVGGAEAISAMAYGTKTIPKVYKIFGAGNSYVTNAKILVQKDVAIDMPAGPSEVCILADETANPKFIAADLLTDGEHGPDSSCVLITTSKKIADQTLKEIKKQIVDLSTSERAFASWDQNGVIKVVKSLNEAFEFINNYAPEHLEIMTKQPEALVPRVINAGSVLLGSWTAKSAGDYATGANHILPTGGAGKMHSPLSVEAFGKLIQVQKCTRGGLLKIKETIEIVATVEQLPAHKNSVSIRFVNL